jgi:hypothetical protein
MTVIADTDCPIVHTQEEDIPGTIPKTVLPGVPDWVSQKLCSELTRLDAQGLEGDGWYRGPGRPRL